MDNKSGLLGWLIGMMLLKRVEDIDTFVFVKAVFAGAVFLLIVGFCILLAVYADDDAFVRGVFIALAVIMAFCGIKIMRKIVK